MWPWRTVRSELRTAGVNPAQAHSLRAEGKRLMSPISATRVMAVSRPMPGRVMSAWTRGSGLASAAIWRSSRVIGAARASSSLEAVIHDRPWGRWQLQRLQPRPPWPGPQALVLADAAVGQHRVDPVLQAGGQADQAGPVA
jgi:hypothetical protein